MSLTEGQPNWFDSTETGAPTLNNATGALLEVLRACLVNGFNPRSVTSIVVASGVATATAATHGYTNKVGKLVLIEGSGEALLNGRKQPLTVATNTFTFAAPGVADGTYTGTITAKRAPLGWVEAHTGTNVAIFARTAPEATDMLLRVNDSAANGATATEARVLMVESATDVDTYTDEAPLNSLISGGGYLYRGANNATAKVWGLCGNDRFMYLFNPAVTAVAPADVQINYFGDGIPYRTPDAFFCLLVVSPTANAAASLRGGAFNGTYNSGYVANEVVARSFDGSIKAQQVAKGAAGAGIFGSAVNYSSDKTVVPILNTVQVVPTGYIGGSEVIRGELPGIANPLCRAPFSASPQFSIQDASLGGGTKYLSVLFVGTSGHYGNALFNLSDEWYPS